MWDACSYARIVFSPQDSSELHFKFPAEEMAALGVEAVVDDLVDDEVLGHIVENDVILHALTRQLQHCPSVEVRRGVSIDGLQKAEVSGDDNAQGEMSVSEDDGVHGEMDESEGDGAYGEMGVGEGDGMHGEMGEGDGAHGEVSVDEDDCGRGDANKIVRD